MAVGGEAEEGSAAEDGEATEGGSRTMTITAEEGSGVVDEEAVEELAVVPVAQTSPHKQTREPHIRCGVP